MNQPPFVEYTGFDPLLPLPSDLINAPSSSQSCVNRLREDLGPLEATGRERLDKCPRFLLSEHDKKTLSIPPELSFFSLSFSLYLFPFLWLNSIKRIPESVLSYRGLEKLRGRMASERFFSFLVKGNTLELIRRFPLFPQFLSRVSDALRGGGSFLRCG